VAGGSEVQMYYCVAGGSSEVQMYYCVAGGSEVQMYYCVAGGSSEVQMQNTNGSSLGFYVALRVLFRNVRYS